MKKLSLSIAVFFSTFFSPHLFSANLLVDYDEHKEGSYSTQPNNQVEQPKQVCDYTILNHKNINHTLEDIEDVEEDLRDDVSAVNQRLVTTNNQSIPLLLGAVLRHEKTKEYHQYLIADTGLLSKSTQLNAVKRAHRKGFHLIKATRGHVCLQLLEWLQISKHYSVTALHTNRPVCRNCYLIAHSLWEKELKTNEKGCIESQFSVLDKMPNLAQQYINTHLNFPLVQNLVVPMMGYVSKEEMNKAIQQKDKQLKDKDINHQQQLKEKEDQLEEKDEKINMLGNEINKKDNQLKEKEQKIAELQKLLEEEEKNRLPLNDNKKKELFEAIENNKINKVNLFLDAYKDVVTAREKNLYQMTPFLYAAEKGKLAIAKLLKERGANIKEEDKYGNNALHAACEYSGNVEMVTWLLDECKIDIEVKGYAQKTPFLFAAETGQLAIAKLLKERGANIHAEDSSGDNALHEACFDSGSVEMVTWLLDECNIDIEEKGKNQKTPFLCAAYKGHLAIAKLLKERGANIHAKNKNGDNALWYADGNNEMINYLKSLGLTDSESSWFEKLFTKQ